MPRLQVMQNGSRSIQIAQRFTALECFLISLQRLLEIAALAERGGHIGKHRNFDRPQPGAPGARQCPAVMHQGFGPLRVASVVDPTQGALGAGLHIVSQLRQELGELLSQLQRIVGGLFSLVIMGEHQVRPAFDRRQPRQQHSILGRQAGNRRLAQGQCFGGLAALHEQWGQAAHDLRPHGWQVVRQRQGFAVAGFGFGGAQGAAQQIAARAEQAAAQAAGIAALAAQLLQGLIHHLDGGLGFALVEQPLALVGDNLCGACDIPHAHPVIGRFDRIARRSLGPLGCQAVQAFAAWRVGCQVGVQVVFGQRMQRGAARIVNQVAALQLGGYLRLPRPGTRPADQGLIIQFNRLAENRQQRSQPLRGGARSCKTAFSR
jgi:hypothetical protein